jgi:CYTH domain-containing protein
MSADDTQILVAIAELRGEVRGFLLRAEQLAATDTDHEQRIRILEQRPVITTRMVVSSLTSTAAIVAIASPFLPSLWR